MQNELFVENNINVSIAFCTYNGEFECIKRTLDSIVSQKNVNLEIVISDDASADNHFDRIREYFNNISFFNYKLLGSDRNYGTVHNYLKGIKECSYNIIKGFGQGDCFSHDLSLYEWVCRFIDSGKRWSFCKPRYFNIIDNKVVVFKDLSHPVYLDCYYNNNEFLMRYNYLINDDKAIGATTLCYKNEFIQYLSEIKSSIIYCEDYIYRLMMFYNKVCYFYDEFAIMYEYNVGVSSGNVTTVSNLFSEDNKNFEKLITLKKCKSAFQFFVFLFYRIPFFRKVYIKIKNYILDFNISNKLFKIYYSN